MTHSEMLLKLINSATPDEIYEVLKTIGEQDIEKLIGMSIISSSIVRRLTGCSYD